MSQHQNPQQTTAELCYYPVTILWEGTSQEDAEDKVNKMIAAHNRPPVAQPDPWMNAALQFAGGLLGILSGDATWKRNIEKEMAKAYAKEQGTNENR